MEEGKKNGKNGPQNIYIEDRNRITVTGVLDVGSFQEEAIQLSVPGNSILVRGSNLHIQRLELEEGEVIITGLVQSAIYTGKKEKSEGSFLKRMLK